MNSEEGAAGSLGDEQCFSLVREDHATLQNRREYDNAYRTEVRELVSLELSESTSSVMPSIKRKRAHEWCRALSCAVCTQKREGALINVEYRHSEHILYPRGQERPETRRHNALAYLPFDVALKELREPLRFLVQ